MRRSSLGVLVIVAILVATVLSAAVPRASAADLRVVMEEKNILMNPDVVTVTRGDRVTIAVYNNDSIDHTFDLVEFDVHLILPPQTIQQATFTADTAGTFWFACLVPGHATQNADGSWSGMGGRLIVNEPPSPAPFANTILILVAALVVVGGLAVVLALRRKRQG